MDKTTSVPIVDDCETMLRIIRNLLKQLEYDDVEEAADGQEALARRRAGQFGPVISDRTMQPVSGLDLLKEVRADARLRDAPFIMVTARAAGMPVYIVRSFDAGPLRGKVEEVLADA